MPIKNIKERKKYNKKYYLKNKESKKLRDKKYRENESVKERKRLYMIDYRKKNPSENRKNKCRSFGITIEIYNNLLNKQKGVCAICNNKCKSGHSLSIDHCHITGKVRGLLCKNCNSGIGFLNDDKVLLKNAIKYLS